MLVIKEFLPNPVGIDAEGEYIKLFNESDSAINLASWKLKDASGKTFLLKGAIATKAELFLPYSTTKITLNNNGEALYLYDNAGRLIDELSYQGKAAEGVIYGREAKLTPELRAELFDSFPEPPTIIDKPVIFTEITAMVLVVTTIFSFIGTLLLKQLKKYEKN